MANIKSAIKRSKQSDIRRAHNAGVLSDIKTKQKKARASAGADAAEGQKALSELSSALDKAAKRGIIHRNTASRKKANAARALKPKAA